MKKTKAPVNRRPLATKARKKAPKPVTPPTPMPSKGIKRTEKPVVSDAAVKGRGRKKPLADRAREQGKLTPLQKGEKARMELDAAFQAHDLEVAAQLAKAGRPSVYTPTLGARLCNLIADCVPMHEIWAMDTIPDKTTFHRWMNREGPEFDVFRHRIARAREQRAENRAARIELFQARLTDPPAGMTALEAQDVKVAIEAERILMEIEAPKKFGKAVTIRGDRSNPLEVQNRHNLSDEALMVIAAAALADDDA